VVRQHINFLEGKFKYMGFSLKGCEVVDVKWFMELPDVFESTSHRMNKQFTSFRKKLLRLYNLRLIFLADAFDADEKLEIFYDDSGYLMCEILFKKSGKVEITAYSRKVAELDEARAGIFNFLRNKRTERIK